MTAPALVMVSHGSSDPHVVQVTHALCQGLTKLRPAIHVAGAFLGHSAPSVRQVVEQLLSDGVREIVFVPLELTHAIEADPEVSTMVAHMRAAYPDAAFVASRPIGPELSLLNILDERLRLALHRARALELDGLILSSASTGDVRGSALLARRARQWSTHHRLPCLTAVADGTGPSVAQAVQGLRAQGRRHLAVGSFFLASGHLFNVQAELALRSGVVAVSEPMGASREVTDLVLARYAFAAMDLLDYAHEDARLEETEFFLDAFSA
ncbi:sirohydrochlorin chelatase [Nigerium massiliense]|uniref:sirohydrochlorin chelatase n=1 Tax=Nigerium massiliense TaxID=1522317 RepID=UPI00069463D5|nr:CbiX/SirB N-terminal domain-containing protein [Nigerium massiliense]